MAVSEYVEYLTRTDPSTGKPFPSDERGKVFISYKKSDNNNSGVRDIIAGKLLSVADIAVWYDKNLTAGVSYNAEIRSAISDCDAVALLLTKDILDSEYVWNIEIAAARELKKGIIPIAFDISDSDFPEVERRLGGATHIIRYPLADDDGQSDSYEQALSDFDANLRRSLDRFVLQVELNSEIEKFFLSHPQPVNMSSLSDRQKYLMGRGYLQGTGTEQNIPEGISLLDYVARAYGSDADTLKLKLKGDAALCLYEHYYFNEKNFVKAFEYAQLGAGFGSAEAMYKSGAMYYYGAGVSKDRKKAVEWYEKAAEAGNAGAVNDLGYMYYKGRDLAQNKQKAFELYAKAAEAGNERAMHNLGRMYYKGEAVEADKKKAFELYSKSAQAGYVRAYCDLANMYFYGDPVEKDGEQALIWYRKAADAGYLTAMNRLGEMYYYGNGTAQDSAAAYEWYSKSAELGSVTAKKQLGRLFPDGKPDTAVSGAVTTTAPKATQASPAGNAQTSAEPASVKAAPQPANTAVTVKAGRSGKTARWLIPLIILLILIAAAAGLQLCGIIDLPGLLGMTS